MVSLIAVRGYNKSVVEMICEFYILNRPIVCLFYTLNFFQESTNSKWSDKTPKRTKKMSIPDSNKETDSDDQSTEDDNSPKPQRRAVSSTSYTLLLEQ